MPKSSDQIFIFIASVIIVERIFRVFFLRIFSMNKLRGEKIKTNQVLFFGAFIASFYKALFQVNQSFLSFRCLGENCSDNSDFIFIAGLPRMVASLGGWLVEGDRLERLRLRQRWSWWRRCRRSSGRPHSPKSSFSSWKLLDLTYMWNIAATGSDESSRGRFIPVLTGSTS